MRPSKKLSWDKSWLGGLVGKGDGELWEAGGDDDM